MTALANPGLDPIHDPELRDAALGRANAVRLERKLLKQQLHGLSYFDGCRVVAGLVEDPPAWIGSMWLWDLIGGVWQMREQVIEGFFREAGVFSPRKPVRALSPRQRMILAEALRARAGVER